MDFLIKDNCDTAALNMENSQDRKSKAGAKDTAQEEKSRRKTKNTKVRKRKDKKDKHKKRKGKRRAKNDIIADFNPYSI